MSDHLLGVVFSSCCILFDSPATPMSIWCEDEQQTLLLGTVCEPVLSARAATVSEDHRFDHQLYKVLRPESTNPYASPPLTRLLPLRRFVAPAYRLQASVTKRPLLPSVSWGQENWVVAEVAKDVQESNLMFPMQAIVPSSGAEQCTVALLEAFGAAPGWRPLSQVSVHD